jgi:hypothetical protein
MIVKKPVAISATGYFILYIGPTTRAFTDTGSGDRVGIKNGFFGYGSFVCL